MRLQAPLSSWRIEVAGDLCFPHRIKEQYLLSSPQQVQTIQSEIDWNRSPTKPAEALKIEQEFHSTIQTYLEHWRSEEERAMISKEYMNRRLHEVDKEHDPIKSL